MTTEKNIIRKAEFNDFSDIMEVEKRAFGYDKEANLVAGLLNDKSAKPDLSLLAYRDHKAIGHILFTRAYLNEEQDPLIHILAPLAVIPEFQKKGIGGLLIKQGLKILKDLGTELVFVLGHMDYYPRFGFTPDAKSLGFQAPFPIPEKYKNAWMVLELKPNAMKLYEGQIQCADLLNKPEHWRE